MNVPAVSFQYDSSWLAWEHVLPISLSLPLRDHPTLHVAGSDGFFAVFTVKENVHLAQTRDAVHNLDAGKAQLHQKAFVIFFSV